MKRSTEMIITSCAVCPFYERGAFSMLADFLEKSDVRRGTCKFKATGRLVGFPFGRVHIADETKIPSTCPLREGDAIIKIGDGS